MKKTNLQADAQNLKGDTNIEALVACLQARISEPTEITLVGRASHTIELSEKQIHFELEKDRLVKSRLSRKIILTEDLDLIFDESTTNVVALAMEGSYLARLCECYIHPLKTGLFLPNGWETRTESIDLEEPFLKGPITLKRLGPLDFCLSKGAAGREKDWKFLLRFMAYRNLTAEKVWAHWEKFGRETKDARLDPTIESGLATCLRNIEPTQIKKTREDINEILVKPFEKIH